MIPQGQFTPSPVVSGFVPPADESYDPLRESHRGGLGLSDASKGRNVKNWQVRYETGSINLYVEGTTPPVYTLAVAGVQAISLAFDNNMRPVFCWQSSAGSTLRYYDTVGEAYTTILIAGASSGRCCVDDVRDIHNEFSDVIWAYVRDDTLYYRQQRDRYGVERLVGPAFGKTLVRVGQSNGRRLTFQLHFVDPEEES